MSLTQLQAPSTIIKNSTVQNLMMKLIEITLLYTVENNQMNCLSLMLGTLHTSIWSAQNISITLGSAASLLLSNLRYIYFFHSFCLWVRFFSRFQVFSLQCKEEALFKKNEEIGLFLFIRL